MIHPLKLVIFYEDKMYKINEKGQVDGEVDGEVDSKGDSEGSDDSSFVKSGQNEISRNAGANSEDVDNVNNSTTHVQRKAL